MDNGIIFKMNFKNNLKAAISCCCCAATSPPTYGWRAHRYAPLDHSRLRLRGRIRINSPEKRARTAPPSEAYPKKE